MIDFQKLLDQLTYQADKPLLFNSAFFLYFLFFFFIGYHLLRSRRLLRILFVCLFSLYFFYKACGWYVGLVIVAAVVDFNLSRRIYLTRSKPPKSALLLLSLVLNLGLLFYFKYTDFFIQIYNDISQSNVKLLNLLLPVGISFYTFENISYTIDVYRGTFKPVKRFWDYLFFLSFFPKLMMGPIVRAADFIPQIHKKVHISTSDVSRGFFLIVSGCFKKIVLSDYLSIHLVDNVFSDPLRFSSIECLMAVYGYAMVIYCDFSGYSDMAIGIAKWMGIDVNINFLAPYQSKSITEFWRRWHISLSSWLRDYLYIPLGGNRKGVLRTYINLFLTMLIGGFWHGASWNFIFWGGMHGIALALDKLKINLFSSKIRTNVVYKAMSVILLFHFVCLLWIFFKADDFTTSLLMLKQIISNLSIKSLVLFFQSFRYYTLILALAFILHYIPVDWSECIIEKLIGTHWIVKAVILIGMVWLFTVFSQNQFVKPVYLQF